MKIANPKLFALFFPCFLVAQHVPASPDSLTLAPDSSAVAEEPSTDQLFKESLNRYSNLKQQSSGSDSDNQASAKKAQADAAKRRQEKIKALKQLADKEKEIETPTTPQSAPDAPPPAESVLPSNSAKDQSDESSEC